VKPKEAIKIESLVFRHRLQGAHRCRLVLSIPELTIDSGTIVAVLGPTGCGKTTFLKLLCGLEIPSDPKTVIRLFGNKPSQMRQAGQINFSFQSPVLLPWLSVMDNVLLPLTLRGQVISEQDRITAKQAIKAVDLHDVVDAFPDSLSSGMASRAAVAQAVSSRCKVLIMDEVFGTLDEVTRVELDVMLRKLNELEMRATIVFVTHSIDEAVLLADRVIIFDKIADTSEHTSVVFDNVITLNCRDREVRYDDEFKNYKQAIEATFPKHRTGV
jgi:ABC-type nitrate/sulfonate/bicarbonate transport system ATPase subunit